MFASTTLGVGESLLVLSANATANPLSVDLKALSAHVAGATIDFTNPTVPQ